MKRLLLISLLALSPLCATPGQDDVQVLSELVSLTKKTLAEQENLLKELADFKNKREKFLLDPESAKLATQLCKSAMKIEKEIEKDHLAHLLSEELLTEVRFFSKVGREGK
jgi:hypothetical protein